MLRASATCTCTCTFLFGTPGSIYRTPSPILMICLLYACWYSILIPYCYLMFLNSFLQCFLCLFHIVISCVHNLCKVSHTPPFSFSPFDTFILTLVTILRNAVTGLKSGIAESICIFFRQFSIVW